MVFKSSNVKFCMENFKMKRKKAKRITFQDGVLESSCHLILLILNLNQFLHSMNVFYTAVFSYFCPFSDNSFLKKIYLAKIFQFSLNVFTFMQHHCYAKMCIILCPSHTVVIWTFTFHKISGLGMLILKGNFKQLHRPKLSIF